MYRKINEVTKEEFDIANQNAKNALELSRVLNVSRRSVLILRYRFGIGAKNYSLTDHISKDMLIESFKKKKTNEKVAKQFDISVNALIVLKHKYDIEYDRLQNVKGAKLKHRRKVNPEEVLKTFKKTKSRRFTAALHNVSQARVCQILASYGIRKVSKTMTDEKINKLREMVKDNVPYSKIQKELKVSIATILSFKDVK